MKSTLKKVSIQGYKGSFHHTAAETLSPHSIIQERDYFSQVFEDVLTGNVESGVVAIKNSLYGEIGEVTQLFQLHPKMEIKQELALPIQQNLIVIPGTKFEELKEIHSQIPALEQCNLFFFQHPLLKKVATTDTALSVKKMMQSGDKTVGVIASSRAAELYQAKILLPAIQDSKDNLTTFVLFGRKNG